MDSVIPLAQKNTLVEYMILSGADTHPPMLDKDLHSSVPPSYPYSLMNHQTSSILQIAYQSPQVSTQPMTESPLVDSSFNVPVFSPGDDPIACLNKAMAFLTVVASLSSTSLAEGTRSNFSGMVTKSNATSFGRNNASGYARVVKCYNCQGEGHMARQCTQPKRTRNVAWYKDKAMLAEAQEAGQMLDEEQLAFLTKDLDTYDSDCDDISNAKAVLMANISNYGSDVISKAQQDSMILSVIEQMSNPTSKSSDASPIKIEAPKELPKVSLVNESLKKLKFYLARFDNVVKIKTTPDARTEAMASEQFSLGPRLHSMTLATSISGLIPNPIPQQPCIPPPRDDWDRLFQPMFDEYFTPTSIVVSPV
ncbi:retrovirus-related pol polyprotein from transposon TNT 1-94 [Tanacetum coccineum]